MEENQEEEQEEEKDGGQADGQEVEHKKTVAKKALGDRIPQKEMRDLLSEFYYSDKSLYGFLKDKNLLGRYKTFKRHWNDSGLDECKESSLALANALPKYDKWCEECKERIDQRNKQNASVQKLLPDSFETFMRILIQDMALMGKGLR